MFVVHERRSWLDVLVQISEVVQHPAGTPPGRLVAMWGLPSVRNMRWC